MLNLLDNISRDLSVGLTPTEILFKYHLTVDQIRNLLKEVDRSSPLYKLIYSFLDDARFTKIIKLNTSGSVTPASPINPTPVAWLDPSQNIFTDTTHLTPVTADGQYVKAIVSSDGIAYTSSVLRTKETYCGKPVISCNLAINSITGMYAADDHYFVDPQDQADILFFVCYPNGRTNIPGLAIYAQDSDGDAVFKIQITTAGTTTGFKFQCFFSEIINAYSSEITSNDWLMVRMTWNAGSAPLLRVYDAVTRDLISSTAGSGTAGFTGDPSGGTLLPISTSVFIASNPALVYYGKHYRNLGGIYTDREIFAILHDFIVDYVPLSVTPWLDPAERLYQNSEGTSLATRAGYTVKSWRSSNGELLTTTDSGRTVLADGLGVRSPSNQDGLVCLNVDGTFDATTGKADIIFKVRLSETTPGQTALFAIYGSQGYQFLSLFQLDYVDPSYFYGYMLTGDGTSENYDVAYHDSIPQTFGNDWFFVRAKWSAGSKASMTFYDSNGTQVYSGTSSVMQVGAFGYTSNVGGDFGNHCSIVLAYGTLNPGANHNVDYGGVWVNIGKNYTNAELDAIFRA